jgi:hypothetical protein
MSEGQRNQVKKILDEVEQQPRDLRAQLNDQQAKNREEALLLRNSVDLVKDQTTIIHQNLDKVVDGSQQNKTILQAVLEAGRKLQIRLIRNPLRKG